MLLLSSNIPLTVCELWRGIATGQWRGRATSPVTRSRTVSLPGTIRPAKASDQNFKPHWVLTFTTLPATLCDKAPHWHKNENNCIILFWMWRTMCSYYICKVSNRASRRFFLTILYISDDFNGLSSKISQRQIIKGSVLKIKTEASFYRQTSFKSISASLHFWKNGDWMDMTFSSAHRLGLRDLLVMA